MSSTSPPPPYPGYLAAVGQTSYPPPNPTYSAPYDPSTISKSPQGYPPAQSQGYPPGCSMPPAYPQAMSPLPPPPQQPCYGWPGYGHPAQPVMGYSSPYSMSANYNHSATVVVAQPSITVIQTFRDVPVHMNCPHCHAEIVTRPHFETGTFTWIICCVLFFVGCSFGCCFIPFCLDGCKDVIHSCPNCRQQIARYSRI
ncbi:hypothetical protein Btru_045596 [Bulinus truncatus]|nr:hypothetical protein Btru_045596 [Bulinus truncatus]